MKKIWAYHATAFLAAFLLFQIQPITSKALLPGFGGSYMVWGACMVFYQAVLLAGYAYGHFVQSRLGAQRYAKLHLLILFGSLVVLPLDLGSLSGGADNMSLASAVGWGLLMVVGIPVFLLSTTSLVLQRWLSISGLPERRNPYVLYASSNLGSLLGLLTYPVLTEPLLTIERQGHAWCGGYVGLVLLHVFCALFRGGGAKAEAEAESACSAGTGEAGGVSAAAEPGAAARRAGPAVWLLLGAAPCVMMLAATNVITLDVASVPFLWVLPLSVYLLGFVVTFKRVAWYPRRIEELLSWALLVGMLLCIAAQWRLAPPAWVSVALHLSILFVVCVNCSGSLIRIKPEDPRRLTAFYLYMATGGLLGGLAVAWMVPVVADSLVEYPLGCLLVAAAMAVVGRKASLIRHGQTGRARRLLAAGAYAGTAFLGLTVVPWIVGRTLAGSAHTATLGLIASALAVCIALRGTARHPWHFVAVLLSASVAMHWTEDLAMGNRKVRRLRNYYGIYKVYDKGDVRHLQHGTTLHGRQYLRGPKSRVPLSYFHPSTPAGEVLSSTNFAFRSTGMIGLGTGALASYAGRGQEFVVYELDPDNGTIARDDFSYLRIAEENGAAIRLVFGDGRRSLGAERSGSFDLFIVDAFSSGSIPVHLMTVEAFAEYFRVLKPDGLLLLHVSNKILSLEPVVYSNAAALGAHACEKSLVVFSDSDADSTCWMALTKDAELFGILSSRMGWWRRDTRGAKLPRPWTDNYSNILAAML